jgi:hypothetical protein
VGSGQCSAVACHGSPLPVSGSTIAHNEHTTWITRDPHAEAFAVLRSDASQAMVRRLSGGSSRFVPAQEDRRCLECHAPPASTHERSGIAAGVSEGVDCESCHGPAERWLTLHTTARWAGLSAAEKETRYGMFATKDLPRRAALCASCHVGSAPDEGQPGRDVDHDLIAAGHPRLEFEFSGFLANLPAHWVERGRNRDADFPARAWAVGQVASASAAAELLSARAESATHQPSRWPEFSEYDCASCHHSLVGTDGHVAERGRRPGTPGWGSWYFTMPRVLAQGNALQKSSPVEPMLDRLAALMGESHPEPRSVATRAREVAQQLDGWLPRLHEESFRTAKIESLLGSLLEPPDRSEPYAGERWDGDRQRYLAAVPLYQSLVAAGNDAPRVRALLEAQRARLRARGPWGSARRFGSARP